MAGSSGDSMCDLQEAMKLPSNAIALFTSTNNDHLNLKKYFHIRTLGQQFFPLLAKISLPSVFYFDPHLEVIHIFRIHFQ